MPMTVVGALTGRTGICTGVGISLAQVVVIEDL